MPSICQTGYAPVQACIPVLFVHRGYHARNICLCVQGFAKLQHEAGVTNLPSAKFLWPMWGGPACGTTVAESTLPNTKKGKNLFRHWNCATPSAPTPFESVPLSLSLHWCNPLCQVIEHILQCLPKCFILENVKGILSIDNGRVIARIRAVLASMTQYVIIEDLLNTKEHGIPQNRERWFAVGIRNLGKLIISFPHRCLPHAPNMSASGLLRFLLSNGRSRICNGRSH